MRKVEGEQHRLAAHRGEGLPPAEPAGDHQVDDGEQFTLEAEDQALAGPANALDAASGQAGDRRIDRSQEKMALQPDPLQELSDDQVLQSLLVDRDLRELGHAGKSRLDVAA